MLEDETNVDGKNRLPKVKIKIKMNGTHHIMCTMYVNEKYADSITVGSDEVLSVVIICNFLN